MSLSGIVGRIVALIGAVAIVVRRQGPGSSRLWAARR